MEQYRLTRLEIDLDVIARNARLLRARTPAQAKMMAVVKADAYGHGAVEVSRAALANGADALAVAIPEEGAALREAGIEDYFRAVFNSESIGAQKPSAAFFDYVFAHIDGFDRTRALLIGDSPTADIAGGRSARLATCWFDQKGSGASVPADYTIRALDELYEILR